MSTELVISGVLTGSVVKARVRRDTDEKIWSVFNSAFETYSNTEAALGHYDISCTEQTGSGYFVGSFPVLITTAGTYNIEYLSLLASVYTTEGSNSIVWDGSAIADDATGINWITLAEYKTAKGITTTDNDTVIEALIPIASAMGDEYIGHPVREASYVKVFRGKRQSLAINLEAYPATITSVVFDFTGDDPDTVDGSEFIVSDSGILRFKRESRYARYFNTSFIQVNFTAGYSVVPSDLKGACIFMIQSMLFALDDENTITEKAVKDVKIKYGSQLLDDNLSPLLGVAKTILNRHKINDTLVVG